MDRAEADHILLSKGWLASQQPAVQAAVLQRAELVTFSKGEHVYRHGDVPGGFYGVAAGSFGTYVVTPHGGPALAHILHAGWWFGEGPTLNGLGRPVSVRAMETSHVLHVPLEAARPFLRSDPEAARAIGALGPVNMSVVFRNVADLLIRRADRRVGAVLLRVSGAMEDGALRRTGEVCLTQSQLAQMSNASRDLVNRTLSRFEALGWVRLGYNRMAVLEPEALADFAFRRKDRAE